MDEVELHVIREGAWLALQELGEALVHQLHQENGARTAGLTNEAEKLDDARVP